MIQVTLSIKGAKEGVVLNLPATPAEVSEACAWFNTLNIAPKDVRIIGANSPVRNIYQYIARADIHNPEDVEKLNTLAKSIGQMDDRERNIFAGALDAESINGLDDVLELSKHLNDYVILPNISTDTELGRFLVDSGYKDFPEEVQPYLDYRAIGAEYYADNGGAYGPGGYVRRKSSLEQEPVRKDAIITLHMATPTIYNFTVSLPATEEELEDSKYRLGVDNFVQAKIIQVEYSKPYLADLVPKDCICVEDANELEDGGILVNRGYVSPQSDLKRVYDTLTLIPKRPDYVFSLMVGRYPFETNDKPENPVRLDLPATPDELADALNACGAASWEEAVFEARDSAIPHILDELDCDGIDDLNKLAKAIQSRQERSELPKLKAVLHAADCHNISTATFIAENLDDYIYEVNQRSPEEVGLEELRYTIDSEALKILQKHVNLYAYGNDVMELNHSKLTPYGLVERRDGEMQMFFDEKPTQGGMVDTCDYLITYAYHFLGGTGQIVEYARKRESKGLVRITNLSHNPCAL